MDPLNEKAGRYYDEILCLRQGFEDKLVRIGAKLKELDDEFDLDSYYKAFVPAKDEVMKDINEKFRQSRPKLPRSASKVDHSLDSHLIQAYRAELEHFQKDFNELRKVTEPDDVCQNQFEAEPCHSSFPKKKQAKKKPSGCDDERGGSLCLQQVINPGELSKIFVQKHSMDLVRSFEDKPNFDDNLEAIYIYRSKNSWINFFTQ